MATFKFVINSREKTYQVEKEQKDSPVMGKKIGENLDASFLGLEGYELQITGGSDIDGFPMKKDIEGLMKKKVLLTEGVGFRSLKKIKKKKFYRDGYRKRKIVRGNSIGIHTKQINCKIIKQGSIAIEEVLGKKEAAQEPKAE